MRVIFICLSISYSLSRGQNQHFNIAFPLFQPLFWIRISHEYQGPKLLWGQITLYWMNSPNLTAVRLGEFIQSGPKHNLTWFGLRNWTKPTLKKQRLQYIPNKSLYTRSFIVVWVHEKLQQHLHFPLYYFSHPHKLS